MNSIIGTPEGHSLGEFVWIGYDSPPDSNKQQVVVAASYFYSQELRAINLYKIVGGSNLTLW